MSGFEIAGIVFGVLLAIAAFIMAAIWDIISREATNDKTDR